MAAAQLLMKAGADFNAKNKVSVGDALGEREGGENIGGEYGDGGCVCGLL